MKKVTSLCVAIVMGLAVAGVAFADSACHSGTAKSCDMKSAKMQKTMKATKDTYACSMCPEVKSGKPGKCPKCSMNLEKQQLAVKAKAVKVMAAFSCPMHADVTSDKAGKCPKCGMFLEKQNTVK